MFTSFHPNHPNHPKHPKLWFTSQARFKTSSKLFQTWFNTSSKSVQTWFNTSSIPVQNQCLFSFYRGWSLLLKEGLIVLVLQASSSEISLPVNWVTLDGSKSHDDVNVTAYKWEQISGSNKVCPIIQKPHDI